MTEDEFNEYVTELRADPEFYSRELNEVVSEQHRQAIEMAIAAQDRFYNAQHLCMLIPKMQNK